MPEEHEYAYDLQTCLWQTQTSAFPSSPNFGNTFPQAEISVFPHTWPSPFLLCLGVWPVHSTRNVLQVSWCLPSLLSHQVAQLQPFHKYIHEYYHSSMAPGYPVQSALRAIGGQISATFMVKNNRRLGILFDSILLYGDNRYFVG